MDQPLGTLWESFFGDASCFTLAQQTVALRASQLLETGLNYSPPRCGFKELIRFLQVLRYLRVEGMLAPELTDIPVGVVSLPQPAILMNLQWSLAKNVSDITDYLDRIYFAMSSSNDNGTSNVSSSSSSVRPKEFKMFLGQMIHYITESAFEGPGDVFRVVGDEHVIDAIVECEWRKLKLTSGGGKVGKTDLCNKITEYALLLCSSSSSIAPNVKAHVVKLFDTIFLPISLQVSARPDIVQRLDSMTLSPQGLRIVATTPHIPRTGNLFGTVRPSISACGGAVVVAQPTASVREKTDQLFRRKKVALPPIAEAKVPASPRLQKPEPDLDGNSAGIDKSVVEHLGNFLHQFVPQPADDDQKKMDKQFLYREGLKLMDTYPTQFKSITMTLQM